jgi:hypothetical protein
VRDFKGLSVESAVLDRSHDAREIRGFLRKSTAVWSGRAHVAAITLSIVPSAAKAILENAERRLLGSIKHDDARAKLARNAERVRSAQLGLIGAKQRVYEPLSHVGSEETQRIRKKLAEAKTVWEAITVEEILAFYAKQLATS